ncbi:MAG: 50S ribosomal protein L11 methyltransferase [Bdellovibrionaceae bacterium]|nr:50S ribosomal protein L11 methyltransferase [Pseudobdellovibrionaceae bacterium]
MSDAASTYFRVRLRQVPDHLEDLITTHSFEHSALGVSEALAYVQPDLTYDPRLVPVKNRDLDVFFEKSPGRAFFDGLKAIDSRLNWEINEEETKDWLAEWKKGFKPFRLVGPYWIVPSWEEVPAECLKPLRIDPGMAFGTGTHATTQMMAFFIHKLAEKNPKDVADWGLLDVGTGTAVLAMLAHKAGFGLVTGIEIDPEARRTARQNVELNGLSDIEISDEMLEEIRVTYDVVVANIIDGVLIQLQKDLMRVTRHGGQLLLTGILKERDDEFFRDFIEKQPVKVIRRIEKDEWVGYWLEKNQP